MGGLAKLAKIEKGFSLVKFLVSLALVGLMAVLPVPGFMLA